MGRMNGIRTGGDPDFFHAPNPDSFIGEHAIMSMPDLASTTVKMKFVLPIDFNIATWHVDVQVICEGTGNLRREVVTDFCSIDGAEDYDANEDSIASGLIGVTNKKLELIDITAALTAAKPLDSVGLEFIRHGDNDTVGALCGFVGVLIRRP